MKLLLLLAAVCGAVLFTGLRDTGLTDQREARDAQVARELIAEHEVLTPILAREPLFEKPIVAYATEVAAALLPGPAAHRSRELRAIAALLLVILTASIAAEHFGGRAGWWTGLALASMLGLPFAARTDGAQLLATLFAWIGAAGLADALFGRSAGRAARLVVAYGALAAALVTAGPLPALWPLGGLALYLALARSREGWRRARPVAGLALMAGLALPWYAAMFERHGANFLAHAGRFPYATGARGQWFEGPLLALVFLVVAGFPWSTLLPGALHHAATWWRLPRPGTAPARREADAAPRAADPLSRERREEHAAHFMVACLAAAWVPVALYPGPPLPAALPALPAVAMLCGRLLDHVFEDAERTASAVGRAVTVLAVSGTLVGVMLATLSGRVQGAQSELRTLGVLVFVTSWGPFLANWIRRRSLAVALMLLPIAAGTPYVTTRLLPAMEHYLSARTIAETMEATAPARAALVVTEGAPPSLRLYTTRAIVPGATHPATLEAHRAMDGLVYVAFRPADEERVARAASGPIEILLRTPGMVLARIHRG